MKRIFILLLTCILSASWLGAQLPTNRTSKTIIADALAQLPAKNPKEADKIFKEIASTGKQGIVQIINMFGPYGKTDNAKFDYALNGLTNYLSKHGTDAEKNTLISTYVESLNQLKDLELKRLIIKQLELIGNDTAVSGLAAYLNDESLCAPASQTLASINTGSAIDALIASLAENGKLCVSNIVNALATTENIKAEQPLLNMYANADQPLKNQIVSALGQVGTKNSLSLVERSGNNLAYLNLIKRVFDQGDVKDANSALTKLEKATKGLDDTALQLDIFSTSLAANPNKISGLLKAAMANPNKQFRNGALAVASQYPSSSLFTTLMQLADKGTDEQKIDILNAFAAMSKQDGKAIENTVLPALLKYAGSSNPQVCEASVNTLVNLGSEAAIPVLIGLLKSNDASKTAIGKKALAAFNGNINQQVINAIPEASEAGKTAALDLLAMRKANAGFDIIVKETDNESANVKTAAYNALKHVTEIKDLPTLFTLLESTPTPYIPLVQDAIVSAIVSDGYKGRVDIVLFEMSKTDKKNQLLYYPILAGIPVPKSLETLQTIFETTSPNNSQTTANSKAALEAILQWQDTNVLNYLYDICLDESKSQFFNETLDRYIELSCSNALTGENRRLYLENGLQIAKTDAQKNTILKGLGNTNSYIGLLLAGNYLNVAPCQQNAANAVMKLALGNPNFTGTDVTKLLNQVIEVLNNPDAGYQKEEIRKHLALIKDKPSYNSMFNGQNLDGWKGLVADPIKRSQMSVAKLKAEQIKADKQMALDWKVEDGMIVYYGSGYDNLCTDKQYADFEMLVDWKLDPKGREPDAGIYLRGTPQVQIWDIARTNVGAEVGSGGLYNNKTHLSKPLCVADNTLGEWNTLYIKMIGDRVTVKLNGVLVVDNIILENFWNRNLPIPSIEQIELQAHGCRVFYRNLYIKELPSAKPYELSEQEKKEGYKILFDGTNMHQWTGNTIDYIIEDGTISMHPTSRFGGNLYTKDEFGDFIYRFEFQMTPGANNGVGIRTPMEGDAAYVGMEVQILDHDDPIYNDITPLQVHGSVYGIIGADRVSQKPIGEWNYEEIRAIGDHITVILNGDVILDGNIREAVKNGTPDGQEHPGLFNKKGHIAFLGHGSPVKFKNIRIKEVK